MVEISPPNHHFRSVRFIPPAIPILKPVSPAGPDWLHEVKFDGWRLQIHKSGEQVKLYSRRGVDMARRFPDLRDACMYLPEAVIDAELVACDTDGKPDFLALRQSHPNLCVWCFDLLGVAGQDSREQPLSHRREQLRELLIATDDDRLRFSEEFPDPVKLLKVAEKMGLEGVISKRRTSPYLSGTRCGWIKVKTASWRETNKDRGELFHRSKQAANS
jgi:bifunctional non-homologous end joining protein LigD